MDHNFDSLKLLEIEIVSFKDILKPYSDFSIIYEENLCSSPMILEVIICNVLHGYPSLCNFCF